MKRNSEKGVFAKWKTWGRAGALAALLGFTPVVIGGCYGPFPLTKAMYRVNGSVPTGILQTLLFWGFLIIPVYSVSMFIDAVILNLIEFWIPGEQFGSISSSGDPDVAVTRTDSADGREAHLTVTRKGEVLAELQFVKVSDAECEVRDLDGRLLGTARLAEEGSVELADGQGRVVRTIPADQWEAFSGQ
jgi:hypothetical protein